MIFEFFLVCTVCFYFIEKNSVNILLNYFFSIPQKSDLKRHEGKKMMTQFSFLSQLFPSTRLLLVDHHPLTPLNQSDFHLCIECVSD